MRKNCEEGNAKPVRGVKDAASPAGIVNEHGVGYHSRSPTSAEGHASGDRWKRAHATAMDLDRYGRAVGAESSDRRNSSY